MVIGELQRIQTESAKAPQAIYEAEKKLAQAEFDFERAKALAFLNAQGTVADRENLAKYEAAELRLAADIAKAELNRIRAKAKQLSEAGMLSATIAKTVEMTYRG
jgi:hypothetical protein